MPDDPIQDSQDQTTSQPEPTTDLSAEASAKVEEIKPVEDAEQSRSTEEILQTEESKVPELPKEETPAETPKEKPEEPKQETEKKETPEVKSEEPKVEEQRPEPVKEEKQPGPASPEPEINIKEEVKRQLDNILKEKLLENKKKADEARSQKRKDNLNKIVELAKKKQINNQDVKDLLQVSQSTATTYLTELAKSGRLKSEGKAKAKAYKS